jgi:hypothetical protein
MGDWVAEQRAAPLDPHLIRKSEKVHSSNIQQEPTFTYPHDSLFEIYTMV